MYRTTAGGIRRILTFVTFLILIFFASRSNAIFIQAIPSTDEISVGDEYSIDLVINGLEEGSSDEIVKAYHIDLNYTPGITIATGVEFGNYLGLSHPLSSFFRKSDITNDNVMLEEVSLWDDDILASAQPDSFILASIEFMALGEGVLTFDFLPYLDFGIDIKGRASSILAVSPMGGSGTIMGLRIPEPNIISLLSIGLLVIAITRKQENKQ